jgi:catechol 2,3-dioxygenase-like lactoylglutathione lyase family enzyme
MEMKLQLIPLPVTDLERSKAFYVDTIGFDLDHDVEPGNGMRIIQLTPPGSACSIAFGTGMGTEDSAPVKNLHLVVEDIEAIRKALAGRGLEISDINDMGGVKYAFFSDPDQNTWALQQIDSRTLPS